MNIKFFSFILVLSLIGGCKSSKKENNKAIDPQVVSSQETDPINDLVSKLSKPFEIEGEKLNHANYLTKAGALILEAILFECVNANKFQCVIGEYTSDNPDLYGFKLTSKMKFDIKIDNGSLAVTKLFLGNDNQILLSEKNVPVISFGLLNISVNDYKTSTPTFEFKNGWIIDKKPKSKEFGTSYSIKTLKLISMKNDINNTQQVEFSSGEIQVKYRESKKYSWLINPEGQVSIND